MSGIFAEHITHTPGFVLPSPFAPVTSAPLGLTDPPGPHLPIVYCDYAFDPVNTWAGVFVP